MAALLQKNFDKVKNRINPYLHNNRISPLLDLAENKIHVERSIIALGLSGIFAIYLIFGCGNDFICNFIGILYPIYASLSAIHTPEVRGGKKLLIYWIFYSSLICIEYLGHSLFHSLRIYWLVKCIFLIWMMKSGSIIIGQRFITNVDLTDDVQDGEEQQEEVPVEEEQEEVPVEEEQEEVPVEADQEVPVEEEQEEFQFEPEQEEAQVQEYIEPPREKVDVEALITANGNSSTLDLTMKGLNADEAKTLMELLQNNKTLTSIDLGGVNFDAIGAKHFGDALQKNKTLNTLRLFNAGIGVEGVKYFADALRNNTALTTLDLGRCQMGDEGARHLADALQHNTVNILIYL
ncbi:unnamed protein product [Adineta steineri]|uniref:Uncharacterized protein n=1 Tax=Adineta steineri TaxID=433720 RepID=A0A815UU77_9BILA|nr:unnamed protein product [Adineta steineri]